MMKKRYKAKYKKNSVNLIFSLYGLLMLILMFGLSPYSGAYAQEVGQEETVSGQITDGETGETLPGVNVTVKGTTIGTTTSGSGEYQLNVPSLNDTLVFSFVGFQTQTIPIDGRRVVNVTLQVETLEGEELVVVGYGTQTKRDLTGSVSQIGSESFGEGVNTSVNQMLEGRAAGVQVVQNSGQPGGSSSINIRGVGSTNAGITPLYVIDGMPIDNSALISESGNQVPRDPSPRDPLSSLNPEDIESIDILKDASATAIYGSRGANGVILVTTKRGSAGDLKIDYNASYGIQNVHNKLDLLNPEEYQREINEIIDADNPGSWLPSERVTEIQNGGTDWQNEVFQKNAPLQRHNLSFSWGNESTTYFISLNNTNQKGIIEETSYDRYAARFNLRHSTEKLNFGFNATTSYIKDVFVPNGFDVNLRGGVSNAMRNYDPTLSVRDDNGDFNLSQYMNIDNPVAITTGNHMDANRYRYFGTVFGEYFVTPNLSVKLNIGADVDNQDKSVYKDRTTIIGEALSGVATVYGASQSNYLMEGTMRYNETLSNDHRINLMAGITTQKFMNSGTTQQAQGFASDATKANNLGLADPSSYISNSNKSTNSLLSYLARINYTFKDKYLFTGTYRIDGSSRFGEDNKFGYFPSFSVGWLLNEEAFFPFQNVFNQFKLRGSWGQTGNQQIGNNQAILTFGPSSKFVQNNQLVTTLAPDRIPNPDLKWETTEQIDIGLDFSLLEDRISGTIDLFRKETYDMIFNLPVPSSTGFSNRLVNIPHSSRSLVNRGLEVSLNSYNVSTSNFNWSSNITFTALENVQIIDERTGLPLRTFNGFEVIGIWQLEEEDEAATYGFEPGDFKFKDVNSDGDINSEDRVVLGDSFADYNWSLGNTFNYKNFALYAFIQGVGGVKMLNRSLRETYFSEYSRRQNKFSEPFINRWTPDNPTNEYPSFLNPSRQVGQRNNSKVVQDASYIKLQTVKLSYDLPKKLLGGFVRNAEVSLTGQNLVTITDYMGFDPALNPNGNATRIDWNAYPSATTYLIGLNLDF